MEKATVSTEIFYKHFNYILTSEKFHPTLHAEIVGWGSTSQAGSKAYRHVPVQIVPPGDVDAVSSVLFKSRNIDLILILLLRREKTLKF